MYSSFYQSPGLRRLSSYTNSAASSPVRVSEGRRSRQLASSQVAPLRSSSIDGFKAYQEHVSSKLTELHAKVNVALSRSRSPVRSQKTSEVLNTTSNASFIEAPKASVPFHVEEAYKSSRKVAQARPSSAPRSFSFTQQSGSFSNDAYTDYMLDIKRCEGSRNFYDREIAKKATQTPLRTRTSVDYSSGASSPVKSALRSNSISRTYSMPAETEGEKRSSSRLNSSMLGGSPVKAGSKTVTWSAAVGQKETLYDKNKLNQIMSRIAVRQALESRALESTLDRKSFLYAPSYGNNFGIKLQSQTGPYKL